MGMIRRWRLLLVAVLVVAALPLVAACGSDQPTDAAETITASLLIEPDAADPRWYRDIEVAKGTDGYELLEVATDGQLVSEWFPEFRSHFVKEVLGIPPEGSAFWGVFVWNESSEAWEPLPVGADLFSVKQGHVMGWALVEFDPDALQVPVNRP